MRKMRKNKGKKYKMAANKYCFSFVNNFKLYMFFFIQVAFFFIIFIISFDFIYLIFQYFLLDYNVYFRV